MLVFQKPEHRAGTYTISMIVGTTAGTMDKVIGGGTFAML